MSKDKWSLCISSDVYFLLPKMWKEPTYSKWTSDKSSTLPKRCLGQYLKILFGGSKGDKLIPNWDFQTCYGLLCVSPIPVFLSCWFIWGGGGACWSFSEHHSFFFTSLRNNLVERDCATLTEVCSRNPSLNKLQLVAMSERSHWSGGLKGNLPLWGSERQFCVCKGGFPILADLPLPAAATGASI